MESRNRLKQGEETVLPPSSCRGGGPPRGLRRIRHMILSAIVKEPLDRSYDLLPPSTSSLCPSRFRLDDVCTAFPILRRGGEGRF